MQSEGKGSTGESEDEPTWKPFSEKRVLSLNEKSERAQARDLATERSKGPSHQVADNDEATG